MSAKVGMIRKPKDCLACKVTFTPSGNAAKFCKDCGDFRATYNNRLDNARQRAKRGIVVGVGSGGQNVKTSINATESTYRKVFLTKLYIKQNGLCNDCKESFPESILLVHHEDHNRKNNVESNLHLVCKRCHQIEHECWLAFSKV